MTQLDQFEIDDIQAMFAASEIGTPDTEYDEETGTTIYLALDRPSRDTLLMLVDRIVQIVSRHEVRQVVTSRTTSSADGGIR
jgi:hypothetical protein